MLGGWWYVSEGAWSFGNDAMDVAVIFMFERRGVLRGCCRSMTTVSAGPATGEQRSVDLDETLIGNELVYCKVLLPPDDHPYEGPLWTKFDTAPPTPRPKNVHQDLHLST